MAEETSKPLAPADSPTYKRMTTSERMLVVKLHDDGLTQTEIAQRLNRAQSTISDVLTTFADTTIAAKRYLAAKALRMAENVVENGQPRDHNTALAGIGVLKDESGMRIQIAVGVSLPGLPTASEGHTIRSVNSPGSDN